MARTSRVKARETVKASLQADGRVGEVPGSQTSPEKLLPASLMEKLASVLKATEKSYNKGKNSFNNLQRKIKKMRSRTSSVDIFQICQSGLNCIDN